MNTIQQKELAVLVDAFSKGDGIHPTAVPLLNCIKMAQPNVRIPGVYNPSLCVIVQGEKQVLLENEIYNYAPSQYLVISVDLPVTGIVTIATEKKPYLCLQIDIDQHQLIELITQIPQTINADTTTERGLFIGDVDSTLSECVLRLARLLRTPGDIALLAPMITREIYYRLLNSPYGATIAQLTIKGSNMQRITSVIQKIRTDFAQSLRVDDMAELAGMSPSSFHFHFKEVTAMSPLQYQKRLRLTEARRIMLAEGIDATSTAYQVGYESPSQFSREYSRMFGMPPMRDIETLRQGSN